MSVNGINQPSKTNRKATLHDIARNAGVTVGTVSGVLRGKAKERRISEEVAEKIWRVASEMDYAPNLLIRSLHRGHTNILAFLNGFRNRDLQTHLFSTKTHDPGEQRRRSAQITRKLGMLRAHGLIQKVPHTHRYQVSDKGRRIITALHAAREADIEKLAKAA